ncbi:hypothetical protein LguiA_013614 [Lonicera macranthoides]
MLSTSIKLLVSLMQNALLASSSSKQLDVQAYSLEMSKENNEGSTEVSYNLGEKEMLGSSTQNPDPVDQPIMQLDPWISPYSQEIQGTTVIVEFGDATAAADPSGAHTISRSFPHTYGQPLAHFLRATAKVSDAQIISEHPSIRTYWEISFILELVSTHEFFCFLVRHTFSGIEFCAYDIGKIDFLLFDPLPELDWSSVMGDLYGRFWCSVLSFSKFDKVKEAKLKRKSGEASSNTTEIEELSEVFGEDKRGCARGVGSHVTKNARFRQGILQNIVDQGKEAPSGIFSETLIPPTYNPTENNLNLQDGTILVNQLNSNEEQFNFSSGDSNSFECFADSQPLNPGRVPYLPVNAPLTATSTSSVTDVAAGASNEINIHGFKPHQQQFFEPKTPPPKVTAAAIEQPELSIQAPEDSFFDDLPINLS